MPGVDLSEWINMYDNDMPRKKPADNIIDTDFHLTEKEEDFFPYLNDPYDKLVGSISDEIGYGASVYPEPGHLTPYNLGKVERRPVRTVEDVEEGLETVKSDTPILSPGLNLNISNVHHEDLAHELSLAYNRWVLDEFLDQNSSIYSSILVTPFRPNKAADEIDRLADENQMVGVMMPDGCTPLLGHERYEPIYEAAERNNLPFMMHGNGVAIMNVNPAMWRWTSRYGEQKTASSASNAMFQLSSLIYKGIPVKFPDLDFVVIEKGLGWIPYFMQRLDHVFHGNEHDAPMLEKEPSEYIKDSFYYTSQPVEGVDNIEYITSILRLFNAEETLMFASDYPHKDFDHSDELLSSIRSEFTEQEVANIYKNTAKEVFL